MVKSPIARFLLILWACLPAGAAQIATGNAGPRFNITDLGKSQAVSLNDKGQVLITIQETTAVMPTRPGGVGGGSGGMGMPPMAVHLAHSPIRTGGWMTDLGNTGVYRALNNSDELVGESELGGLFRHGDRIKLLSMPGMGAATPLGLNDRGQVVGRVLVGEPNGPFHAFLYSGSQMRDLGTLKGDYSEAAAINEKGQIAGRATVSHQTTNGPDSHAVLWENGKAHDLGTLGGPMSIATAINAHGDVVGWSDDLQSRTRATLWTGGKAIDLGTLTGDYMSIARSINDRGHIVGYCSAGSGEPHAAIWDNDKAEDLNDRIAPRSGWVLEDAAGINNNGQIIGVGVVAGEQHAFLLSPA